MKLILIILLSCFNVVVNAMFAQGDVYKHVADQIISGNPKLKELKYEIESQHLSKKAENMLPPLDLDFEAVWSTERNEKKWSFGVSQSFDFPGAYRARKKEIKANYQANQKLFQASYINELQQAYELLIDVAYCNKAIDLSQTIVNDLKDIEELLNNAFNRGESTILEVNKAKIEYANNLVVLRDFKERRESCINKLKNLGCSILPDGTIDYPIAELLDVDKYISLLNEDPDIEYLIRVQKAKELGIKVKLMEGLPEINVGYVHEFEEGVSFNGFSIGLSLPSYSGFKLKEAARAEALAADWSTRAARIEKESSIYTLHSQAVAMRELYDLLAPVFYQTNHLRLLGKAFNGGQLSAIEYLREVSYFNESEKNFLEVEYRYQLALMGLNIILYLNQI